MRLAAGRYEPFAVLAFCLGGGKGQIVEDFNPYLTARQKPVRRRLQIKLSEAKHLLKQFTPP